MRKINLAIVGATGLVGQKIIKNLIEENLISRLNLTLFVSENSVQKSQKILDKTYDLVTLNTTTAKKKFDIVLFSAGEEVSNEYAEIFINNGAYVIDNSNAFRRYPDVPLVVPELNISLLNPKTKLIANPNCSTIQLVLVLSKLRQLSKIKKVVVSTYQSVSGAGQEALSDLLNNTQKVFKAGINDNLITQIGSINSTGFCTEEDKLMFETSKILGEPLDLLATTVRVPTPYCHGESIYVEFEMPVSSSQAKSQLQSSGIKVTDESLCLAACTDTNDVYVSRVRNGSPKELLFFVIADNLRRGASYNAVMIAKYIIENFL